MLFAQIIVLSIFLAVSNLAAPIEVRQAIPLLPTESVAMNDLAQFIAGIQPSVESPVSPLTVSSEWKKYAAQMNSKWREFDSDRLQPIRTWRENAMTGNHPDTVFYPFSGPDFVHVETFFPEAHHFILCGLEPVGDPPSLDRLTPVSVTLGWLLNSMRTVLDAGYFITKEMQVDLKMSSLQGTLPLLCVMLARAGDQVLSIHCNPEHAEIHYLRASDGLPGTLDYFSINLRDDSLKNKCAFVRFIKKSHPGAAYLKSASYLLHESDFSLIRALLLSECPVVVQDDSGIPYRCFDPAHWKVKVFGTYVPPLEIFKKYYQPDLDELYRKTLSAPLGFGTGYHLSSKSANLVVYSRK